jgi:hypothetical protein
MQILRPSSGVRLSRIRQALRHIPKSSFLLVPVELKMDTRRLKKRIDVKEIQYSNRKKVQKAIDASEDRYENRYAIIPKLSERKGKIGETVERVRRGLSKIPRYKTLRNFGSEALIPGQEWITVNPSFKVVRLKL